MKPAYRPDIDGLRAVAVMGVLLYHYGASWLPGGFTGVDVFFVISGYLITTILRREIEAGEFSILGFYDRRIRRIVPALLVVLAATMAAGWFILMPGDYADLGASAVYAAAGLGNLYFYGNTGYFDQASEMQPLLHTWSLGVEEQFYVVWPIALLLGLTIIKSRRMFIVLLSLGVLLAFAYAARKVGYDPKGAFYLPHPRAWELAIGALLAFLPAVGNRWLSQIMGAIGAALIGWSLLRVSATDAFPGINAAYACVGAALLIWPKAETLVGRSLSFRPVVWIGLISYSLYLWHWPVLVLFRHYANGAMPTVIEAAALGALCVGLAWVSWQFVERPFRKPILVPWRSVAMGLASIAVIALAGNSLARSDGAPQRVPHTVLAMSSLDEMWNWDCKEILELWDHKSCLFGAPWAEADHRAILWGDSHAEHWAPVIEAAMSGSSTAFLVHTPCPAAIGGSVERLWPAEVGYEALCRERRSEAMGLMRSDAKLDLVVISASWTMLATLVTPVEGTEADAPNEANGAALIRKGLEQMLSEAQAPGRRFVLIADVPVFPFNPVPCVLANTSALLRVKCETDLGPLNKWVHAHQQQEVVGIFRSIAAERNDTVAILPAEGLCDELRCINTLNGEFLYRDVSHIRRNLSAPTLQELADLSGLAAALR